MTASTFYKRHCIYLPAMAGWFVCSAALSAYNKVIFGQNLGAFPCPLLLTSVHFFVQWMFSYTVSSEFPDFFGGTAVENMSWSTFLGISIPCGLVTALDIGLSNLSLVRISITFFTMVKSSSPVWVLLSAFVFGLEKITCNLILVGLLITAGEILTAFGEVEFDTVGFLLVLGAAICGGIRWTLVQFKLQKLDPPLCGPVVTMRLLSCTMFFSMMVMSCVIEQPWRKLGPSTSDYFSDLDNSLRTISTALFGAGIAIVMVLCEFWLILKSNAIVLMIGGVLKEMITIFVGVTMFDDNLNVINVSGIVVVFLGVLLYKVTLHLSKSENNERWVNEEDNKYFSRVSLSDAGSDEFNYEEDASARRGKRSRSDPDIALMLNVEDLDPDGEVSPSHIDGISPRRGRLNGAPKEQDKRDQKAVNAVVELI